MYVLTDGSSFLSNERMNNPHSSSPWKTTERTKAYFFDSSQDAEKEKQHMPNVTKGLNVVSMARERQKRKNLVIL